MSLTFFSKKASCFVANYVQDLYCIIAHWPIFSFYFSQCRKRKLCVAFWQVIRTFLRMIVRSQVAWCFFIFIFHDVQNENCAALFLSELCSYLQCTYFSAFIPDNYKETNRSWSFHMTLFSFRFISNVALLKRRT